MSARIRHFKAQKGGGSRSRLLVYSGRYTGSTSSLAITGFQALALFAFFAGERLLWTGGRKWWWRRDMWRGRKIEVAPHGAACLERYTQEFTTQDGLRRI